MPLYDYACAVCDNRTNDVLIQHPTKEELEATRYRSCSCGGRMEREFPLPRRPHVDWTNAEFSYKHGKWLGSTKAVDAAERELKEPSIDKYAEKYMAEERKLHPEER